MALCCASVAVVVARSLSNPVLLLLHSTVKLKLQVKLLSRVYSQPACRLPPPAPLPLPTSVRPYPCLATPCAVSRFLPLAKNFLFGIGNSRKSNSIACPMLLSGTVGRRQSGNVRQIPIKLTVNLPMPRAPILPRS